MIQISEFDYECLRTIAAKAMIWADDMPMFTREVLLDEEAVARRPIYRAQSDLLRAVMAWKQASPPAEVRDAP